MKPLSPTAAAAALLAAALVVVTPACAAPARAQTVTLQISGGHATDPVDHERPVVLVAAGLGVPTDVFRAAFSGVHPAGPGSGGPTEQEAQANKAALMAVLAPYGITNERLDAVSNHYRYMASDGELWRHRPARATAVVRDGRVVSVRLLDGGAGYSSTPTVTVPGASSATVRATVSYGTDLATNGAITRLEVVRAG
jgi:hypothetical protein